MEEDVLGLEISVQNIVIVHILNSVTNLLDNASNFFLGEPALEFQVLVKVSTGTQLHQEVETALVAENGV